ncbi:MAG TPA: hypothetical protein VGW38_08395 [Chloroflexota bacterium]|nr:hypothetical protein [Chloroflexota bacterium]
MQPNVDDLYSRHIRPLPAEDRLRLLAIMAQELAAIGAAPDTEKRSLLELEGVGVDLWKGMDAQVYVDGMREEWEHQR